LFANGSSKRDSATRIESVEGTCVKTDLVNCELLFSPVKCTVFHLVDNYKKTEISTSNSIGSPLHKPRDDRVECLLSVRNLRLLNKKWLCLSFVLQSGSCVPAGSDGIRGIMPLQLLVIISLVLGRC
jgi:hypothetical protein